jgi:hypothetical protein
MNANAILAAHEQLSLRVERLHCNFLSKEDREANRIIATNAVDLSTKYGIFFRNAFPLFLALQRNAAADKRNSDKINGVKATLLAIMPDEEKRPLDSMKSALDEIVVDFGKLSNQISALNRKLNDKCYGEESHRNKMVGGAGITVIGVLMCTVPTPVTVFVGVMGIIYGTAAVSGAAAGASFTAYGAARNVRGGALEKFRTDFRIFKADVSSLQAFFTLFSESVDNELRDQRIRVGEKRDAIDLEQIDALTSEFLKLWEAFKQFPLSFGSAATTALEQPVANDDTAAAEKDPLMV